MKAKITYINNVTTTIIENPDLDFLEFCKQLFNAQIYFSKVPEGKGFSLAINTPNIVFVEEVKE